MAMLTLASVSVSADAPWFVRAWQSDEGLPDNTVVGIVQTPDGFLWVASQTGLVRFDGIQFSEFPIQVPGMEAGTIHALCADQRGRLWIARERGTIICMEQGRNRVMLAPDNTRANRRVRSLVQDGEGAVWASFVDGDLARLKDGGVRFFTAKDGLPIGGISELTVDSRGQLWHLREKGVGVFRDGRFLPLVKTFGERIGAARSGGVWVSSATHIAKYTETGAIAEEHDLQMESADVGLTAIHEDRMGRVWIGTRLAGLFCFADTGLTKVPTGHQTILSVSEDRDGNIWVGTRGGGMKQVRPRVIELRTTASGIPFDGVLSICEETNGVLWAAIWQKGTVVRSTDQGWMQLSGKDGWTIENAFCVAADPQGGVWIGTSYNGLYRWQDGAVTHRLCLTNGLSANGVSAVRTTVSGAVWIGVNNRSNDEHFLHCWKDGKLRTFPLPSGCGGVTAIEVDASGDCWVATARGVLVRVRGDRLINETSNTLAKPPPIRSLLATPDKSLWIGYGGMGLGHLQAGRFTLCRREQGLYDDYISQILSDGRGWLWLAGNRGISSVRKKDLIDFANDRLARVRSVAYKQKDGMPGLQASFDAWPNALRGADGRLLFATQSGIATVYAEEIKGESRPLSVVIDRVLDNGKAVAIYGAGESLSASNSSAPLELGQANVHLRLPPGRRQIEFVFTAPSVMIAESIGFKYRLQGVDHDWLDAGMRRSIIYSQLSPGHYCFQVTACNRDGVWSEQEASLALSVEPFWWETVWFRVVGPLGACLLLGGLILFGLRRRYQFKIERLELFRAMEKERTRIAADLHDEIGANLTHISILSSLAAKPATESEIARQHNVEVTSVARQTILAFDEILWSVNPKNDTLHSLSHYICRRTEEILGPAKIAYHFALAEAIPESPVSPQRRYGLLLAVKEALHNILKHARASRVTVQCEMDGKIFVVNMSDNGRGFDPACIRSGAQGRKGHGVENMRQRLAELGGECRIESRVAGGTQISFRLPID